MPSKTAFLFLSLFLLAPLRAQVEVPDEEKPQSAIIDSVIDTSVQKILSEREVLTPKFGFQDIFIEKGGSAVLDLHRLGLPTPSRKHVIVQMTRDGLFSGGGPDKVTGGERVVAGNKVGSTQVIVYEKIKDLNGKDIPAENPLKVYNVTVSDEDLITLAQEVKTLIGPVEGIDVRIVGSQVVIDGRVLIVNDIRRINQVKSRYQAAEKPVISLVEVSPKSMQILGEKMEEEIAGGKDRPKDIRVKVLNGRFFLEGAVDKLADREAAMLICQAYLNEKFTPPGGDGIETPQFDDLPECVQMVRIRAGQPPEPEKIISVRVDFVTLERDYLKAFDFRWSPGVTTESGAEYSTDLGQLVGNFTATISNLFPKLDTAAAHGHARILKSANLLMRDGPGLDGDNGPQISETLQINVEVDGGEGEPNSIQTINVQTVVKVLARSVPGSDKINIDVTAQQAELQSQTGGGTGPPNVLTSSVRTSLVVSNGESAAMGGLVAERRRVSLERDPANDPTVDFNLFEFGRGQRFEDKKQQFIVFITPTKLRSPAEGTETLKRKFRLRR